MLRKAVGQQALSEDSGRRQHREDDGGRRRAVREQLRGGGEGSGQAEIARVGERLRQASEMFRLSLLQVLAGREEVGLREVQKNARLEADVQGRHILHAQPDAATGVPEAVGGGQAATGHEQGAQGELELPHVGDANVHAVREAPEEVEGRVRFRREVSSSFCFTVVLPGASTRFTGPS